MMVESDSRIGQTLLRAGYISLDQLAEALDKRAINPGKRLGEILINLGYLGPSQLEKGLALQGLERELARRAAGSLDGAI